MGHLRRRISSEYTVKSRNRHCSHALQEPLIPTSHPYGSQDKFASSRFLPTQTSYQQQFNVPAFGQPQPRSQTAEHHPHRSHGDGVHSRHAGANVFKHPHKQAGNSPLYSPYPAQARPNPLTLTPHAAASGSLLPLPGQFLASLHVLRVVL